ncbi:MAG: hypothetical protein MJY67_05625 [Bacteroidales bacterium]|nr:hypothetical protein [Bacteroidales bacterium]
MKLKKKKSEGYDWKFCQVGGVTRINIESGKDIAHLGELDQKLWTVLGCPAKGMIFDQKTLNFLDVDGDGKIRVPEVVAASKWLTSVLKDPDLILKGDSVLPLSALNQDNEEGKKLYDSAKQILSNLGLEKEEISVADASDSVAIFAKTQFNGDGVITVKSAQDEALAAVIDAAVKSTGGKTDRSGEAGVTAEQIEAFYAACADYAAWQAAAKDGAESIFPYGDNTQAALEACDALKEKIADYFMRCKLVTFHSDSVAALDVSTAKIETISDKNLAACQEEIGAYPLARVTAGETLPLSGINPAWQSAFQNLKTLVFDVAFPGAEEITEAQWNSVLASFGAYTAWKAAKKGECVEALGLETIQNILEQDKKAELLSLVEADLALADEANAIDAVEKLLYLYRDFYQFIRNFVTFSDFYSGKKCKRAILQADTLFNEQRSCDLCIEVADMGKHGDMAGQSGMFIVYCNCTHKTKGTKLIAAVLTDGDVDELRVGKNCVFYDREGSDWDATVVKIVENPISVRQAFWSPYRKVARMVENQVNKMAAEKDSKMMADASAKVATPGAPAAEGEKKAPFDIAKFAGIFAAIGLAFGAIGAALTGLVKAIAALSWWQVILVIVGVLLLISGPAMFLAWLKLRKRNLAPVLNANGWAINSHLLVNILFGATLTSMAKYPKVTMQDPFAKKMPLWKKILICLSVIIAALGIAFAALYLTNKLEKYGLQSPKAKKEAKAVADSIARADSIAALDSIVAIEAPAEAPVEETQAE